MSLKEKIETLVDLIGLVGTPTGFCIMLGGGIFLFIGDIIFLIGCICLLNFANAFKPIKKEDKNEKMV